MTILDYVFTPTTDPYPALPAANRANAWRSRTLQAKNRIHPVGATP